MLHVHISQVQELPSPPPSVQFDKFLLGGGGEGFDYGGLNSVFYHFLYIQSILKYICPQYELVNILMIEILKVVEKCKIYKNKRSREACGWPFDKKIAQVAGICQTLEICFQGGQGFP